MGRRGRWGLLLGLIGHAACGSRAGLDLADSGASGEAGAGVAGAASGVAGQGVAGAASGVAGQGVAGAGVPGGGGSGQGGSAGAPEPPQKLAVNAVWPGAGCGRELPPNQSLGRMRSPVGYTQYTVMGTGANLTSTTLESKAAPRTFWVRVPTDYDQNKPYRLVFVGQGCGAFYSANQATYYLYDEEVGGDEQAVYVALDIPTDHANQDCYDNRDGLTSQEWEAFQLFMEFVDQHFCVDLNRIYVAGYSTGGWLANMWGCYFAGWPTPPRKFAPNYHVRAQAVVAGGEPAQQPTCNGPVAALWLHDQDDSAYQIPTEKVALLRVGQTNACDTTYDKKELQAPWHSEVPVLADGICQKFVGCPADYPVIFCTTNGLGHASQAERAILAFTMFFDEIEGKR